jgi:ABC-2 type transport system ATP-binding protein
MTTTPEQAPDEVATVDERGGNDADREAALAVRNLTKTFEDGDESVQAVDDVSLAIRPGTVMGVLGPNGAGKTTLIKSILGLVIADEGDVSVAGTDVYADPRAAYARVGAMLEGARNVYWKLTVQENLEFFAAVGGESPDGLADRHEDLLDQLSLREKADTPVNDLSRGQKQKVSLACALARDVDIAFLDEPTLGLDVESSVELRGEIRRLADQEDMTIVLSSHNMDVVQDVCDRVVIMNDGKVIADDAVADLIEVFRTSPTASSSEPTRTLTVSRPERRNERSTRPLATDSPTPTASRRSSRVVKRRRSTYRSVTPNGSTTSWTTCRQPASPSWMSNRSTPTWRKSSSN